MAFPNTLFFYLTRPENCSVFTLLGRNIQTFVLSLVFMSFSPTPIPIISSSLIGRAVKNSRMRLFLTICPKCLFLGSSHVHAPRHTPQGHCPSVTTEWTGKSEFLYTHLFVLEVRCKLNWYLYEFNSVLLDFHSVKFLLALKQSWLHFL